MIQELQVSDELKLLPIKLEDAESLFALIEKNRDHLRQWLHWLDFNTCVENSKEFIENSNKQAVEKTGLVMNINNRGAVSLDSTLSIRYIGSAKSVTGSMLITKGEVLSLKPHLRLFILPLTIWT